MLTLALTVSPRVAMPFCIFFDQFKTSLFMSVQAEVEDVTWVVKEMADQRPNNAIRCSTPSPFPVSPLTELSVCDFAPKVTSF